MEKIYTTKAVAVAYGISQQRVGQLARLRKVGKKIGRDWLFSLAEVKALQPRRSGRPRRDER